ncbi:hypothetical protein O6H91_19G048000 [Diphasiastrum complanatum]|uniref:Uncharacterized protein n=1 Tax=Diphasiastrum complanatum TaxID=34168 RepID=A0ACC2AUW3_DIPCM|nr:hypothetical protein O6H91_19G048000 [Diphasiastrum complanatum]
MTTRWNKIANQNKHVLSIEKYADPGKGGIDLSRHKSGQAGFDKSIEKFQAAYPSYDRGNLDLSEKVVLVGDASVGKTCLILRFTDDVYKHDYKSTIGVDFFWQKFICQQYDFMLNIWDTAGQERFRSLSKAYYRGAQACIVAFDLGVPETLTHAKQECPSAKTSHCAKAYHPRQKFSDLGKLRTETFDCWVAEVTKENQSANNFCVFLAGCKADMFHAVAPSVVEKVAFDIGAEYFEVSSLTGQNVKALFRRVATVMFETALSNKVAKFKAEAAEREASPESSSNGPSRSKNPKVVPIGGGKGVGDTGAGKGTENWKSTRKQQGEKTHNRKTFQIKESHPPAHKCCKLS